MLCFGEVSTADILSAESSLVVGDAGGVIDRERERSRFFLSSAKSKQRQSFVQHLLLF